MNKTNFGTRAPPMDTDRETLCRLYENGTLWEACDEYISSCFPTSQVDTKSKKKSRFPNLAGFCRYLGTGLEGLGLLKERFPDAFDRMLAIFEDEALNSEVSTTLLPAYMKKRLSFGTDDELRANGETVREVTYCFEHDVYTDGE